MDKFKFTTLFNLVVGGLLLLSVFGCKKEKEDVYFPLNHLQLFNDSSVNPGTFPPKIIAWENRLLMVYGHGPEGSSLNDERIQTFFILCDNAGKLIRQGNIPAPSFMFNVLASKDGTFHIICGDHNKRDLLNIHHFDHDGNSAGSDSILLKDGFMMYNVLTAPNGHFILRNWYISGSSQLHQFQETDLKGNILWSKVIDFKDNQPPIFPVSDGGFFHSSNVLSENKLTITKYNAVFDTAWSKSYSVNMGFKFYYHIVPMEFNNKVLVRINEVNPFFFNDPKLRRYNLYIDMEGDSLDLIQNNAPLPEYFGNSVIRLGNGTIFTLAGIRMSGTSLSYPLAGEVFSKLRIYNEKLELLRERSVQNQSSDFTMAACRTSDGRIACLGFHQVFDRSHFKPFLMFTEE